MPESLQSIFVGTAGLTLVAVVSLWLSVSRNSLATDHLKTIRWLVGAGVALHICHFFEESLTGFYERFPGLLGLVPWSPSFFMSFNLAWIVIWLLCIPLLDVYPRAALFPIWFLAIASTANAIVHPLLALATGGYFPGLWSSPLVGVVGLVLLRTLASATRSSPTSRDAT